MIISKFRKYIVMILSLALCASSPVIALAAGSVPDNNAYTVDDNGNWVYTRIVNGKEIKIHVTAGSVPGDGKDAKSDLGFGFPGRGFVYDGPIQNSKTGHSQEAITNEIKEMTNLNVKSNNGAEIYLDGQEDWIAAQKVLANDGITKAPDKKIESVPYTTTWDGIHHYAYPSYYASSGSYLTKADTPHHVKFYSTDGAYAGSVNAILLNGKYVTDTTINGGDYYAVIFNDGEGISTNASYTIK